MVSRLSTIVRRHPLKLRVHLSMQENRDDIQRAHLFTAPLLTGRSSSFDPAYLMYPL